MNAKPVFEKLRDALETSGVPYLVTGSFVSSAHGVPRATNDVDVVIAPTREQLIALLKQFPPSDFYSDLDDALDALERRSQFNVIDQNTLWKIDFIVSRARPFDEARFQRRALLNIADVLVYAATAEDVLLAKLEWAKLSESNRQIDDAAGIIRVQGDALDTAYIEYWVKRLALEQQWATACSRSA